MLFVDTDILRLLSQTMIQLL